MTAAQRNGELVTHLARQGSALREPKVMRIGRKPAAHEARAGPHQLDVTAIAYPSGLRQRRHTLVEGVSMQDRRSGQNLKLLRTLAPPVVRLSSLLRPRRLVALKAVKCASFASNIASTWAASDVRKRFFSGSLCRAHCAACSVELRRLISAINAPAIWRRHVSRDLALAVWLEPVCCPAMTWLALGLALTAGIARARRSTVPRRSALPARDRFH
jgi:hypothetical protein